jgi:hypothetical protein
MKAWFGLYTFVLLKLKHAVYVPYAVFAKIVVRGSDDGAKKELGAACDPNTAALTRATAAKSNRKSVRTGAGAKLGRAAQLACQRRGVARFGALKTGSSSATSVAGTTILAGGAATRLANRKPARARNAAQVRRNRQASQNKPLPTASQPLFFAAHDIHCHRLHAATTLVASPAATASGAQGQVVGALLRRAVQAVYVSPVSAIAPPLFGWGHPQKPSAWVGVAGRLACAGQV